MSSLSSEFWRQGNFYFSKKEYEKAGTFYRKAAELAPDERWGWDGLGRAYALSGKCQEAKESFEKILAINPDDADVYFNIGAVYATCFKDKETAQFYGERASKILEQKGVNLPLEKF